MRVLAITVFLLTSSLLCQGQDYVYLDKVGDEEKQLYISKHNEEGTQQLVLQSSYKYSKHTYSPPGCTSQWQLKDQNASHDFLAKRNHHTITVSGKYAGKAINKKVEIDKKPWINKLDHGLSNWVVSGEKEIVFWALKLNSGLDPVEFEAEKVGREAISTAAGNFQTIKVKLRLHGFLISNFWSATLWFRETDGLFVKYAGDSGPGTSLRTISLQKIL